MGLSVEKETETVQDVRHKRNRPEVFYQKSVLDSFSQFTWKHFCQSLFFNKAAGAVCNLIEIETPAQVFMQILLIISWGTPPGEYLWKLKK